MSTILLIGTFDTKGEEYGYVRELITARGHGVLLADVSVLNQPELSPDVSAAEVAKASGSSLEALREQAHRGRAVEVMAAGLERLLPRMYEEQKFDAVLSLGGGTGTAIATAGMRALPAGVPKVMVSTLASSDVSTYVDISDITMLNPVVDIAGLNRFSRRILANAAGAVCGMAEQPQPEANDKPLIAASMFGVTTPCVTEMRRLLEEAGYEVAVFHATGSGGRAMERLIEDGYIAGVADITTTEWCDEVVGGVLSAGSDRLSAAGKKGIPQVVSCGALDMVNFHALNTVPEQFNNRNLHQHTPNVTLMRTSAQECAEIGRRIAGQLNKASGPTVLVLPLKGVSMMDRQGAPFHDPQADKALFEALRAHAGSNVEVHEVDMHINDPAFAKELASRLLALMDTG